MYNEIDVKECLAATKHLWWKEPDFLRFPPQHLEQYYYISETYTGKYYDRMTGVNFCHEIPNTNPKRYFCSNNALVNAKDMSSKPFYVMKDAKGRIVTEKYLAGSSYTNVFVGDRACFVKQTRANHTRDYAEEVFFSLIASVFHCGPEVLDFWSYWDEPYQMYRVSLLMEKIYTGHDWCDARNKADGKPFQSDWTKEFLEEYEQVPQPLITQITEYLNVMHPDTANNFGFYKDGKFMLFDWAGSQIWQPDKRPQKRVEKRKEMSRLSEEERKQHSEILTAPPAVSRSRDAEELP